MMTAMTVTARTSGGGFELLLEVDSDQLLPGRLVDGRLTIRSRAGGGASVRGARVTMIGTETWRHDETTTDAEGHTRTEIRTSHQDLPKIPIALPGASGLAVGEERTLDFKLPIPSLGPPTIDGTELRVDWVVRANLDVPGFDPDVELPVRVLQPVSLLRAGVIDVAQFALFDAADAAVDDLRGTIRLEPMPLCVGAPFGGSLTLEQMPTRRVQEVRLELRVQARSTVSGGREETIVLWAGRLAGPGDFGGAGTSYAFEGTVGDRSLPTARTPHGRADATFHVVIAVALARDPHLVRDVAICSTLEV